MAAIVEKVSSLWPEIVLLIGAIGCLITGLSPLAGLRRATPWVAAAALVLAGILVPLMPDTTSGVGLGGIAPVVKLSVVGIGLVLLAVAGNLPGSLRQIRDAEAERELDAGRVFRGEFFAFFLISLTGVMLTAGADDLAWLFLALELTSLPTYVMVATARDRIDAQESAVKYFFLGAMSAAIFLYGFALIYGATGHTNFAEIHAAVQEQIRTSEGVSPVMLMGVVLAIVGLCFKIAAAPMHFYAADVYEGAATPVTAFLAFVPKTAGFAAMILVLGLVGWPLDPTPTIADSGDALPALLWVLAAVTMTLGNILALIQHNVKRVLAYSSVAHSGYILVGLLAGPAALSAGGAEQAGALSNGIAAILFYLVAYGLATIAGFAVLGCLSRGGQEAQTYDDLSGLRRRQPMLAATMIVAMLSLVGLPPLAGFVGKLFLVGSTFEAGYPVLVVVLVINSAISAAYYLRIAGACYFGRPDETVSALHLPARQTAAAFAAIAAIVLGLAGGAVVDAVNDAGQVRSTSEAASGPSAESAVAPTMEQTGLGERVGGESQASAAR